MTGEPKTRQYRIDHGLCPQCGKEAAPYYLCWTCRSTKSLAKMLDKGAAAGVFRRERSGRHVLYGKGPRIDDPGASEALNGIYLWDLKPDDKRLRPRMGRRPVDLDETLMSIFATAEKPLTIEEVYSAWGSLRSQRKHETLASDMTALIKAQRKREMRTAKRIDVMTRASELEYA